MKRARFGIKVYKVCQSLGPANGYVWNMKVYTAQHSDPDSASLASTKVVMNLNQDLLGKEYIFIDNWYSSSDFFPSTVGFSNQCLWYHGTELQTYAKRPRKRKK